MSELRRVHVAGLPVVAADVAAALDLLWADVAAGRPRVYAFVNAQSATLRRRSAEYARSLEAAAAVPLPDGAPMTAGARVLGLGAIGRCPGPDFMAAAMERAAGDGTPVYLLGGGEGVADTLAAALCGRYPGLRVAGTATPPFGEWPAETSASLAEAVRASGARVLWLGVSAPKQEVWALAHLAEVGMSIACVGAAFDFLSGSKPRAPRWVRAIGMEWLFRLVTEPKRVWRRYVIGNWVFVWDLVRWGRREAAASAEAGS